MKRREIYHLPAAVVIGFCEDLWVEEVFLTLLKLMLQL